MSDTITLEQVSQAAEDILHEIAGSANYEATRLHNQGVLVHPDDAKMMEHVICKPLESGYYHLTTLGVLNSVLAKLGAELVVFKTNKDREVVGVGRYQKPGE